MTQNTFHLLWGSHEADLDKNIFIWPKIIILCHISLIYEPTLRKCRNFLFMQIVDPHVNMWSRVLVFPPLNTDADPTQTFLCCVFCTTQDLVLIRKQPNLICNMKMEYLSHTL